jgi:deoxyribose-phosphate aldolase
MVINVGFLRSGLDERIAREIEAVVNASCGAIVKVIIETCYLTDEQKIVAARYARDTGADFVKTSTGYGPSGAKLEDVALLAREVPGIAIKASGGIRTLDQARAFIGAGASRIGTSAGPAIVAGKAATGK